MKENYIAMGAYYCAYPQGLVRTICKATNGIDNIVVYVNVIKGGYASEVQYMLETDFKRIFLK